MLTYGSISSHYITSEHVKFDEGYCRNPFPLDTEYAMKFGHFLDSFDSPMIRKYVHIQHKSTSNRLQWLGKYRDTLWFASLEAQQQDAEGHGTNAMQSIDKLKAVKTILTSAFLP